MQKNLIFLVVVAISAVAIWFFFINEPVNKNLDPTDVNNQTSIPADTTPDETDEMELVVYLQDKEVAATSDCSVTYTETITVPKTTTVADASLAYLFTDELAAYGKYQSVAIVNGVAEITLDTTTVEGSGLTSLSSCQAQHLLAVLNDTLLQYDSITSIELYSATEKIEF